MDRHDYSRRRRGFRAEAYAAKWASRNGSELRRLARLNWLDGIDRRLADIIERVPTFRPDRIEAQHAALTKELIRVLRFLGDRPIVRAGFELRMRCIDRKHRVIALQELRAIWRDVENAVYGPKRGKTRSTDCGADWLRAVALLDADLKAARLMRGTLLRGAA